MNKIILIVFTSFFIMSNLFAGCMKSEIKQLDAQLNSDKISSDKKAEVKKLRDLVVANEHKDSSLAFESYDKAVSLLN